MAKKVKLTISDADAWDERNKTALRTALTKAQRDISAGRGVAFDPMRPGILLKRILASSRRPKRAA